MEKYVAEVSSDDFLAGSILEERDQRDIFEKTFLGRIFCTKFDRGGAKRADFSHDNRRIP